MPRYRIRATFEGRLDAEAPNRFVAEALALLTPLPSGTWRFAIQAVEDTSELAPTEPHRTVPIIEVGDCARDELAATLQEMESSIPVADLLTVNDARLSELLAYGPAAAVDDDAADSGHEPPAEPARG